MHPALRKGPLFTKKHPPISFPAYKLELASNFEYTPFRVAYSSPLCTNMQWRSQKFSTAGASICSIFFCPFPFSFPTKSAAVQTNNTSYRLND